MAELFPLGRTGVATGDHEIVDSCRVREMRGDARHELRIDLLRMAWLEIDHDHGDVVPRKQFQLPFGASLGVGPVYCGSVNLEDIMYPTLNN